MIYPIAPLVGWVVAGALKFLVNSARRRGPAFAEIGYGGFPSTHTTVVATPACLIGFAHGWNTPAFSIAAAVVGIVVIDALSLRRQIGFHAARLNVLMQGRTEHVPLRERLGHRAADVAGGLALGCGLGYLLARLL